MKWLAVVTLLVVCACGRYSEPRMFTEELRRVPDVVQQTVADASDDLEAEGFFVRLTRRGSEESLEVSGCPRARVVSSDPAAGERVVKATTVTLEVARCP